MATFIWKYHRVETEYPDSGFRVQLGNSYQYAAPPSAPDQRKFTLKFPTMKYFVEEDGITIDLNINREINFAALEAFYNTHKLYAAFDYPHPVYGILTCKFNKPLKVPEGIENGGGALKAFELEFIEVPGITTTTSDLVEPEYVSM